MLGEQEDRHLSVEGKQGCHGGPPGEGVAWTEYWWKNNVLEIGSIYQCERYGILEPWPVWGTASRSTYLKFRVYRRLLAMPLSLFCILSIFLSFCPFFLVFFLLPPFSFLLPPQVTWLKISQLSNGRARNQALIRLSVSRICASLTMLRFFTLYMKFVMYFFLRFLWGRLCQVACFY